jgi:ELWxxDGT repeat protein
MQKNLTSSPFGIFPERFACVRQLLLSFLFLIGISASAQLRLVKDINTTPGASTLFDEDYTKLMDANGRLFFVVHNRELWTSSSSSLTATFLKEFEQVSNLTNVGGTLFFTADDGEHGLELWKSNGTFAGTVLVKDIRSGADASTPQELTDVNGTVFFSAYDGLTGRELWKSDGTSAGTVRVKDILHVVGSSNPSGLVNVNNTLFFNANDGQNGYELWKSDGTAAGTVMVKDIREGSKISSQPKTLVNVNGTLFFSAVDASTVRRLWKSDGTTAGTVNVSTVPYNPTLLTAVNGILFFGAQDGVHGLELWKSDGTSAGTTLVKDLTPGAGSSTGYGAPHLSYLKSIYNRLYFLATTPGPGIYPQTQNLWISDGTEAGTQKLTQYPDITFSFINPFITGYNGLTYFTGTVDGLNMFRTNGTPDGESVFLENIAANYTSDAQLTTSGSYLYFISHGNLRRTNGTTVEVVNGVGNATEGSYPEEFTDASGTAYFSAVDATTFGLWKTDGTEAGTALVRHVGEHPYYLTVSGNSLYYIALAYDDNWDDFYRKLWKTDLTTGVSNVVSDVLPGQDDPIYGLTDVNGTLFFVAEMPTGDVQLLKTTGTLASTQLVRNFNSEGGGMTGFVNGNGILYFSATDGAEEGGEELWKSDGTTAGTVKVKEINPNPGDPSTPMELTFVNNKLFFIAYDGYDYEVWTSDGTAAGTVKLKDIRTSDNNEFDVNGLMALNGSLYFSAAGDVDGSGNYQQTLWKSDGTEAGTVEVATFAGWLDVPNPRQLKILGALGDDIIFSRQTNTNTFELWKTDETEAGTVKLADFDYLQSAGFEQRVAILNGVMYFNVFPFYAVSLWRTDGTACGTFELGASNGTMNLTASGNNVFLSYTSEQFGKELYAVDESAIDNPCAETFAGGGRIPSQTTQEGAAEQMISHYPNPFVSEFTLNVSGKDGGVYDVKIMSPNGASMGSFSKFSYNRDYALGTDWSPGVYIMHVKKENQLVIQKVIKTR